MILFPKLQNLADLTSGDMEIRDSDSQFGRSPGDLVPSTMPASNVQDIDLSEKTRVLSTGRSNTFVAFERISAGGITFPTDALGIYGTNLSASAKWRVLAHGELPWEVLRPSSISSHSGWLSTPTTAQVTDDPDVNLGGGDWHTPHTTIGTTVVRYAFPAPSPAMSTGSAAQVFRIRAGLDDGTGTPGTPGTFDYATMKVELYEAGSPVGVTMTSTERIDTTVASGGQVFSYFWDADPIGNPADLQIQVTFTPHGSSTMGGTVMAAVIYSEAEILGYDSGWLDVYENSVDPDVVPIPRAATHVLSSQLDTWVQGDIGEWLIVQVWDEDNADGYIDLGRVHFGEKWQPTHAQAFNWSIQPNDKSIVGEYRSGQPFADERSRCRDYKFLLKTMTKAEADELLLIAYRVGTGGEIVFVPDQTDAATHMLWSGLVRFKSIPKVTNNTYTWWRAQMELSERVSS